MQEHLHKLIKCIVLIYLYFIYPCFFLISPRFGPLDDHLLLSTIQSGHKFPLLIGFGPEIGRFFPLLAEEYNLISLISKLPVAYFTYNLLQYIIMVMLIVYMSKKIATEWYGYIACIFLTAHPGFVSAWFRLMVPDRNSFFLFTILVACYVRLQHKQSIVVAIVGLISANLFGENCLTVVTVELATYFPTKQTG